MPFKQDHEGISVLLEIGVAFFPIGCWLKTEIILNELDDKMTSLSLSNIHKYGFVSKQDAPNNDFLSQSPPPNTKTMG